MGIRRGFTLIEILIVLGILILLVSISIPIFIKYKKTAIVSYVQQNLVNCASQLMAEYANNGTDTKNCTIDTSNDSCELEISENGSYIKISTSYCIFWVNGIKVKCEIKTDYGDVNGRIDCYQIQ